MKNLLITALVGFLALNPFSKVAAPDSYFTPRQCAAIKRFIMQENKPHLLELYRAPINPNEAPSLARIVIAHCERLESALLRDFLRVLSDRERMTTIEGGNHAANVVLASHQRAREIMDNLRLVRVVERIGISNFEWASEYASDALLTVVECNRVRSNLLTEEQHTKLYGREMNVRICNNMVELFKKEIDNSLKFIGKSGISREARVAELNFIRERKHQLRAIGVELETSTRNKIKAAKLRQLI